MVNPNLLTEQNGFVAGELVQIDSQVITWHGLNDYDPDYKDWITGEYENIDPNLVNIIRPLTGPMAEWNFAPDWAEYLKINDNCFIHEWMRGIKETDKYDPHYERFYFKRPFWAVRKKSFPYY